MRQPWEVFCLPAAVQIRRLMIMLQMPERRACSRRQGRSRRLRQHPRRKEFRRTRSRSGCFICQTRQREADTHTRMIWEFRECSRTSDFPTIRLCGKSMSQIPTRMRQSRRFRSVSTRDATLSLRPAGVTWRRQRRWRRNIPMFIFPMEPVI